MEAVVRLKIIGTRQRKLDVKDKVLGRTVYASDLRLPGMLIGKIQRSPHAHARVRSIDVSAAERVPGVHAVVHAGNVSQRPFGYGSDNVPLKGDKVRCAGDEVAAVAAEDEDAAARALDLIVVDYEVLPAVLDPYEAQQPGAPLINDKRDDIEGNISMRWDFEHGDVEAAAGEAAVIVEGTFSSPLSAPCSIETHCCLACFDSEGHLDVWTGVHMAFMYRKAIAECLGLDWREVRVHQPPIGGSFGGKIDIDPIDFVTVLLAKAARRPVKIHFSREEEFAGSRVRQPMHFTMRTGSDREGNILFRDADIVSDNGAYNAWGSHVLLVVMQTISSLYRVPNCRVRSRVVYTNKAYGGSVRGFGNPEGTFAAERQTDLLAEALGVDPIELRLRNANRSGDVTPQRLRITSCGLSECLETVRLITGASELRQGSETVLAMVTAETLGVPLAAVRVVNDDSELKPWDVGAHASRTTFVAGNSARLAALALREKLLETAGEVLEADTSDIVIEDGVLSVRGTPARSVAYDRVARRRLLRQAGSMLMATSFYDPPTEPQDRRYVGNISAAYGFGAHVAEVEVDVETGFGPGAEPWCAHDVGRALNPAGVEGQVQGRAVMGLGLALTEELGVADGHIVQPSPGEYGVLTALAVPPIHLSLVETIDPEGPFGAKGVGEAGPIPVAAAVANAVADATGVRPRSYPLAPWKVQGIIRPRHAAGAFPPTHVGS